jgi:hypothetical protein
VPDISHTYLNALDCGDRMTKYYLISTVSAKTDISAHNILRLEALGVFPTSACHHQQGRIWIASEVDEVVEFLDAPGARDLLLS